jgi:hypothetical protein
MSRRRLAPLLALALGLAGLGAPALAQCAMCRGALASSLEGVALQGPLNRAILVLLAAPYLVLGAFVLLVWREHLLRRRGSRQRVAQAGR